MDQKRFVEPQQQPNLPDYQSVASHSDNPPPYYSQQPEYVQPTITIQPQQTQRVYTMIPSVGPTPCNIVCPSCRLNVVTRLDIEVSTRTHIVAGILCLVFWPCFWIPYVVDTCKNKNHYCPSCNTFIGTYRD